MSNTPPQVAIGVPVYNGERYLEEALKSIQRQTFGDLDIVVSDNASTDRSPEIVRDLMTSDARIRYFRQPTNLGAAENYNFVFREAKGVYFRWLAADDRLGPQTIEACRDALEQNPGLVTAYPVTEIVDAIGRHVNYYDDRMQLSADDATVRAVEFVRRINLCNPALGLHRSSALANTQLIQPFIGSDAVLLFEMVLQGKVAQCQAGVFQRRMHAAGSHESARSKRDLQRWFTPRADRWLWIPTKWRLLAGYLEACSRHAPSKPEAARASTLVLIHWMARTGRVEAGRIKASLLRRDVQRSNGRWPDMSSADHESDKRP